MYYTYKNCQIVLDEREYVASNLSFSMESNSKALYYANRKYAHYYAPEEPIEKIIEVVMKIKNPVTKISFVIVITAREEFIEKLQESKEKDNKTNDEILRQAIDKEFSNNEISSIRLKKGTIRLIIKEEDFKNIEARWKSKKMHVTHYFNQILLEALK